MIVSAMGSKPNKRPGLDGGHPIRLNFVRLDWICSFALLIITFPEFSFY